MPFFNLDNIESNINSESDFTIIGCGAVGIFLALKLSRQNFSINVIESGDIEVTNDSQKLNKIFSNNDSMKNSGSHGRYRSVGGSTTRWGGQALIFNKIDFENRSWVKNSGWPIEYSELTKFYNEANEFMELDSFDYDDKVFNYINSESQFKRSSSLNHCLSKWAKTPNFFTLHKKELNENVNIFYNATLIDVDYNEFGNKVKKISVKNKKGQVFQADINNLLLCAGGIESVRTLLLDPNQNNPHIGKFFMEHPHIYGGKIKAKNLYNLQKFFNTRIKSFRTYTSRLLLSETYQRKHELLNASAIPFFVSSSNELDIFDYLRKVKNDFNFKYLFYLYKGVNPFLIYMKEGFLFSKQKNEMVINLCIEQNPDEKNKIILSDQVDDYGKKIAEINWSISNLVKETAKFFNHALKKDFKEYLGEEYIFDNDYLNDENNYSAIFHHIGGTKISISENDGVVDKNLKLHNCDNYFICSSSIFPTSSHSNPTLSILAFAARLVNHLITKYS